MTQHMKNIPELEHLYHSNTLHFVTKKQSIPKNIEKSIYYKELEPIKVIVNNL